jgi:hypothetical protein
VEEGSVDRTARVHKALLFALFLAYCALVVYLIVNPSTRIIGVLNVALVGYLIPRWILPIVMDDLPYLWRSLVYAGWHGKYRAFEDRRVRVIDGERQTPSRVFAADIFDVLGQSPSAVDLAKLAARYGTGFEKGTDGLAEDEWLFADEACMAYVRGYMDEQRTPRGRDAMKLALWLEREVFMPIDNRRSAETGKTYAFTREAAGR